MKKIVIYKMQGESVLVSKFTVISVHSPRQTSDPSAFLEFPLKLEIHKYNLEQKDTESTVS